MDKGQLDESVWNSESEEYRVTGILILQNKVGL